MKFNYEQYWNDFTFANGLEIKVFNDDSKVHLRNKFLVDQSIDKNVIHLGFANHLPLIDVMIKNDTWLHAHLCASAKRCLGIDINETSIAHIKEKYGYRDVICADIINDKIPAISDNEWDLLVIPDVLEHVNNPIEFLKSIKINYSKKIKKIIITVPNAFDYKNVINLFKAKEVINTDHRLWYSPYTLAKIATLAGLKVDEIFYADSIISYKRGLKAYMMLFPIINLFLKKRIIKRFPAFSETIIMTFEVN